MWVKRDEMLIRGINELILLICGDLQATSYTPAGWLKAWDPLSSYSAWNLGSFVSCLLLFFTVHEYPLRIIYRHKTVTRLSIEALLFPSFFL